MNTFNREAFLEAAQLVAIQPRYSCHAIEDAIREFERLPYGRFDTLERAVYTHLFRVNLNNSWLLLQLGLNDSHNLDPNVNELRVWLLLFA
jgi:hypothetical protein